MSVNDSAWWVSVNRTVAELIRFLLKAYLAGSYTGLIAAQVEA
jgi:hypothetical protein